MATDRDIRDVEVARLVAIVDEHGREDERHEVAFWIVTIARFMERPVDVDRLASIARRVERRTRLGLPAVDCAGDPPTPRFCGCLDQALGEPGGGGKRSVLRRAAALHWSPPPRRSLPASREPEDGAAYEPSPASLGSDGGSRIPGDPAATPPRRDEPTPRFYRRSPKWFDPERRSFTDMKF